MNTRTFVIATLVFFSLAPAALASLNQVPLNGVCTGSFDCISRNCIVNSFPLADTCGQPLPPTYDTCVQQNGVSACDAFTPAYNACLQQNSNDSRTCQPIYPQVTINKQAPATGGTAPATTVTSPPTTVAPTTVTSPPTTGTGQNVTLINPLKGGASLESFLNNILDFVIRIGAIIVVLMLVYVGFLFVTAQGNETKITEARKALLWTVVGALILLGAKAIALGITATVQALSVGQ